MVLVQMERPAEQPAARNEVRLYNNEINLKGEGLSMILGCLSCFADTGVRETCSFMQQRQMMLVGALMHARPNGFSEIRTTCEISCIRILASTEP